MAREEIIVSPEELLEKIEQLSEGGHGIVLVPGSYWNQLEAAYYSNLWNYVSEKSIGIFPKRSIPDGELSFRLLIKK